MSRCHQPTRKLSRRLFVGGAAAAAAAGTSPAAARTPSAAPLLITQKTAVELGPAGKLWDTRAP
ncbi:hypothetical protein ACFW2D_14470 [Streptomyces sp. NPDC058914]|uniref:hypothetical protein n=1 Tax=Streptomyces TaxID=1883 RepID=UPI00369F0271